ncbi:hypothetical protein [Tahibacter soli]|uniref:Uncharacterized protein n=1 Tax=Tahibacter soli TaxID=2983605 RepID=A0A9X3YJM2_9GAMM|nr:hypothetical protein [Tahibacter soli]MDC8012754.1 hypothetical protein [Tahibacter soli]
MHRTRTLARFGGLALFAFLPAAWAVPCPEEAKLDPRGNVTLPAGATEIEGPEDVDEEVGPLSTVYPDLDTTTDAMYPLPCEPSIGGTLPPEAEEPESDADIANDATVDTFEKDLLPDLLGGLPDLQLPKLPAFNAKPVCYYKKQVYPCDSEVFLRDGEPFAGRDIIYIHGLSMKALTDAMSGHQGATSLWPNTQSAYQPGGYFYDKAVEYWTPHIREHLWDIGNPYNNALAGYQWPAGGSPSYVPKGNRLLIVAWSTAQRLEYAQHAFLTQVIRAMNTGQNVLTPPSYPPDSVVKMPFCANGCIVVTHSTGGLIMNSAMGRLQLGDYGAAYKPLVKRFRGHIAMASALSGSRLASAAIALSSLMDPTDPLCDVISSWFGGGGNCGWSLAAALQTVLVDLTPLYTHQRWHPVMEESPVTTITVSGAHTRGNYAFGILGTKLVHPGNDDGVVTMDSSCGNPTPVAPWAIPSTGFMVTGLVKAFDLGIPFGRAVGQFWDQRRVKAIVPLKYMSAMCSPWLAPSGMVMPVEDAFSGTILDSRRRLRNVYSFIQGAVDHSFLGGTDDANPLPSASNQSAWVPRPYRDNLFGNPMREESSAITDAAIYAAGPDGVRPVHPLFAAQMKEYQRGRKISFKLFGIKIKWWLWRRTYHLLNNWQNKAASHFAYEYAYRRN